MLFYVGLHHPHVAKHFERAFVSVNAIRNRKSDFQCNNWIMDSGAFTEISTHGGYRSTVEDYAKQIERWRTCGNMEMAVAQDFMCEPFITEITGMTVTDHQELTVARYDALKASTDAPIMPVLQGFKPSEYLDCLALYGDRLTQGMRVGVGSICKRNSHPAMIEHILGMIKAKRPDLRLHGFGLKLTAIARTNISNLLYSADSMAWSFAARKEGRNANDWREAKDYENRINSLKNPCRTLELFT